MDDEWLFVFLLPFWVLFGYALIRVALNVWRKGESVFFMNPAAMLYPENQKYALIMGGCMFVMIAIVAVFNVLFLTGYVVR